METVVYSKNFLFL